MKKTLLLLFLLPMFSFGQTYSMIPQSLSVADLTTSPAGGGGGSISITNNVLTVFLNAGWATAPLKLGVIKYLNITPVLSYLELGPIMYNSSPTVYYAKIVNNNLTFFTTTYPVYISGCSLSFTKSFTQSLDKILFTYDLSGNQIQRTLCINCTSKRNSVKKEEIVPEIITEDNISYYPNPVKEELYLRWELANSNTVSTINVYSMDGKLLQSFQNTDKINLQTIPFLNYPTGVYAIVLFYSNGEQKSIKIIKQ